MELLGERNPIHVWMCTSRNWKLIVPLSIFFPLTTACLTEDETRGGEALSPPHGRAIGWNLGTAEMSCSCQASSEKAAPHEYGADHTRPRLSPRRRTKQGWWSSTPTTGWNLAAVEKSWGRPGLVGGGRVARIWARQSTPCVAGEEARAMRLERSLLAEECCGSSWKEAREAWYQL
jgi:hypothetical protein